MKKIIGSLLIISAFAFSANAQTASNNTSNTTVPAHNQWHHHHKRMDMMKQLNLTPDQQHQLKAYHKNYREQMQALNKNESITVKEFRDKKYALHQDEKAKFLSLLTSDQKNKLDQLKQQRQQQHEAMAAKRLDKMKTKLSLSDNQVAQIKSQMQDIHSKMKAIKDDQSLGRLEKKQQLEALKSESKENFKKILTPDQLNKMEELKKERMQKFQGNNPS